MCPPCSFVMMASATHPQSAPRDRDCSRIRRTGTHRSLLLSNADVTFSFLQALKAMGLKLAIDDFGTGYSSLSYLKHFPVSKLKIDRSFVRDVAVNLDDAAITTAIISMAKSLNLKVICGRRRDRRANVVPAGPSLRRNSRLLFQQTSIARRCCGRVAGRGGSLDHAPGNPRSKAQKASGD